VPQTVDHVRWPPGVRAIDLGDHTFYREIGLIHRPPGTLSEPARALAQMFGEAYRRYSDDSVHGAASQSRRRVRAKKSPS